MLRSNSKKDSSVADEAPDLEKNPGGNKRVCITCTFHIEILRMFALINGTLLLVIGMILSNKYPNYPDG